MLSEHKNIVFFHHCFPAALFIALNHSNRFKFLCSSRNRFLNALYAIEISICLHARQAKGTPTMQENIQQ